jgi:hypothetical protein
MPPSSEQEFTRAISDLCFYAKKSECPEEDIDVGRYPGLEKTRSELDCVKSWKAKWFCHGPGMYGQKQAVSLAISVLVSLQMNSAIHTCPGRDKTTLPSNF